MTAAEHESVSRECKSISKRKSGKTIMVTGLAGTGKSTFVNSVFELASQNVTTETVRCYRHKQKNGVEAMVYDMPGFDDPRVNEHRIIADMKLMSEQKLDHLLYCVSVASPGARVTQEDVGAFHLLTNVFGVSLWKNATFVITCANVACERLQKDQYFQLVENVGRNLRTYLHEKVHIPMDIVSQIPLLTAGDTNSMIPYEEEEWTQRFIKKIDPSIITMTGVRGQTACQYVGMQQDPGIDALDNVKIKVAMHGTREFTQVSEKFQRAWAKGSCPPVSFIFIIVNRQLQQRWSAYQQKFSDQRVEEHYHGTVLQCDITTNNNMCNDKDCGVCGISKKGFDWLKSNSQRFHHEFYFGPNPSKCHEYTQGAHGYRAILLCDVCPERKYVKKQTDEKLQGPSLRCDSVHGRSRSSFILHCEEYVDDCILPHHIILYIP